MRISILMRLALVSAMAFTLPGALAFAQETTGGLQGTVKDASGAVVSKAHIEVKLSLIHI